MFLGMIKTRQVLVIFQILKLLQFTPIFFFAFHRLLIDCDKQELYSETCL